MKKIFLILSLCAGLYSCEDCYYEYKIANQTGGPIEVSTPQEKCKTQSPVSYFVIADGQTVLIYTEDLGSKEAGYEPKDKIRENAEVLPCRNIHIKIGGEQISDAFKLREHWDFVTRANVGTYTLTLTPKKLDELGE